MILAKLKHSISLFYICLFVTILPAQELIHLNNPSFESLSQTSSTAWVNCGDTFEQKPDVQPNGAFGVRKEAWNGSKYISLVTRDNNTVQAVGQRLSATLEANKCYDFALILAKSERYISRSRTTQVEAKYTEAIKLQIWGGNTNCEKNELLAETALIKHSAWKDYVFHFHPTEDLNYIVLEASYGEFGSSPYNGNILIDDASPILEVPCHNTEPRKSNDLYQNEISTILLDNKSFEETVMEETSIRFWKTCDEEQGLMTIEPTNSSHSMPVPHDGINYISLKTDDNTLRGAIDKSLKPYLQAQQCYRFSFWAARTNLLVGSSPFVKKQPTNFDGLVKIKIWGSQTACAKGDLLAQTPLIRHEDWKKYEFILQPEQTYTHLKIEAAYAGPIQFFYNGHVLLDELSDIELLNGDSLEYYYENLTFPIIEPKANLNEKPEKYSWIKAKEKPKNKPYQSFTYSVRDSEASINENLEQILLQTYPDYILLFNIFAPTKEDGIFQKGLLIKELERLKYPKHWYKTKTYLED